MTRRAPHLLVVDDDRLILMVVEDFFRPHGYRVDTVQRGTDALDVIRRNLPDVIVADILMPEMDGWELYEKVRAHPRAKMTPFIFLTQEKELPKKLRGLHSGADDYVTKPFDVEELHARVERVLERRRAERRGLLRNLLLAGSTEHLPISDLMQILSLNHRDAVIRLAHNGSGGSIVFEGGRLVHAELGSVKGKKALHRMMAWPPARFRVHPLRDEPADRSIDARTTDAVMDGLVALDRWNRLRDSLPDRRMHLEFLPETERRLAEDEVTAAEVDVMARSKQGRNIAEILEESQLPDAELAEAICALVGRGVVRPVVV